MEKPLNIASTAHSQHAELQTLLGAQAPVVTDEEAAAQIAELTDALKDEIAARTQLLVDFNALKESNAQLVATLEAEREAHAKTSAALAAATQPAA